MESVTEFQAYLTDNACIGDGLYVGMKDQMIILYTRAIYNGVVIDNQVSLEPKALESFLEWVTLTRTNRRDR